MIRFVISFLRSRRALIVFYLLVVLFFGLVALLYGVNGWAVGYTLLILSALFAAFLACDAARFHEKMRRLREARDNLSQAAHELPAPSTPAEEAYQAIIHELYYQLERQRVRMDAEHADQLNYYTMWLHQIKTPISAIRLKQSENADPVIEGELFKIEQYVDMALKYVKLADMSTDLVLREYPLEEIVRASVKKYALLFICKKLYAHIEPMQGATAPTDSVWLGFVIEQLLSNAVKYTREGGVTIRWSEGVLSVSDTGIGIRDEDIRRVFEKGFTGLNGRIERNASGIGLYMARRVAQKLSIEIDIRSSLGKGTCVSLRMPKLSDISE